MEFEIGAICIVAFLTVSAATHVFAGWLFSGRPSSKTGRRGL